MKILKTALLGCVFLGIAIILMQGLSPRIVKKIIASYQPYESGGSFSDQNSPGDGEYCFKRNESSMGEFSYILNENVYLQIEDYLVSGKKWREKTTTDSIESTTGWFDGTLRGNALDLIYSYRNTNSRNNREQEVYEISPSGLIQLKYPLKEGNHILIPDRKSKPEKIFYTAVQCAQ